MTDLRKAAETSIKVMKYVQRIEGDEWELGSHRIIGDAIKKLEQALAQPEQECELLRKAIKQAYIDGVNNGIRAATGRNIT